MLFLLDRSQVYSAMNKVLAQIHSVDVNAAGIGDYGKQDSSYVARTVKTWTRQYEASKTKDITSMDKLIAWLPQNIPQQRVKTSVVHGDFRVDNLIFDVDDPTRLVSHTILAL